MSRIPERVLYLIDKYIWVFHCTMVVILFYFGIKEFFNANN